jgi:hypothetical protein
MFNGFDWFGNILEVREVGGHLTCGRISADMSRTDSLAWVVCVEVEEGSEVVSPWVAWAEAALHQEASEVDSLLLSEADSEDEVHLDLPAHSADTDTTCMVDLVAPVVPLDETSATTSTPTTTGLREVPPVPLPSHLVCVLSQPSPISRSSFET